MTFEPDPTHSHDDDRGARSGPPLGFGPFGRRRGRPGWDAAPWASPGGWARPGPTAGPHRHGHGHDHDREDAFGESGFAMGFGPGGRPRFGPGRGPGGRRRRGDVRAVLLAALLDGDAHGYELIRRLEERAGGAWRPSAGSVYPTLQLLEDEDLVRSRDEEGKRVFSLTDAGRTAAEAARDGGAWDAIGAGSDQRALGRSVGQLAMAVKQVTMAGDATQIERATAIVTEARQALYRLLAGD